ncbi:MAG: hypothetical protein ACRCU2_31690 [Planktothrix sp.]
MSLLVECLSCGKSISSENYSCIHCKAKRCRICGKFDQLRNSSLFQSEGCFCRHCLQDIESAKLPSDLTFYYDLKCSLCGHINKLLRENLDTQSPLLYSSIIKRKFHDNEENKQKKLNIEYGFLTKKSCKNWLFGPSIYLHENTDYIKSARNNPNQPLKNFLSDSLVSCNFSCSSCGQKQSQQVVFPVKFKVFKCACCKEFGKLEAMDVLVYHYDDDFYEKITYCKYYEEVTLAHRSCLKYREKLFKVQHSYSMNKENTPCEIWSVEQVLKQADLIDKIIEKRVQTSNIIFSRWSFCLAICASILMWYLLGWIGFTISFVGLLIYCFLFLRS